MTPNKSILSESWTGTLKTHKQYSKLKDLKKTQKKQCFYNHNRRKTKVRVAGGLEKKLFIRLTF